MHNKALLVSGLETLGIKNQDNLNNYLSSELWKGIATHPNLVNFKTDNYAVASISLISNGVPAL